MRSFHEFLVAVLLLSGVYVAYDGQGATGAISGVSPIWVAFGSAADVQIMDMRTETLAVSSSSA
jgi:hypothetical protein